MHRYILTALFCVLLSISFIQSPANGFISLHDSFDAVTCVDDGNNIHLNATELEHVTVKYDAVCQDDAYDWYRFSGWGDVGWITQLLLATDGPALDVRAYFDNGGGLTEVFRGIPDYNAKDDTYSLSVDFYGECLNAGFTAPLSGDFWLRTSLSDTNDLHNYFLMFMAIATPSTPGTANASAMAKELPIGEKLHGTLTENDVVDWYYWEHPVGEPVDGFLELVSLDFGRSNGPEKMAMKLNDINGNAIALATFKEEDKSTHINLPTYGLSPGPYFIKVMLSAQPDEPITYQVRNRATSGITEGYATDSNESQSTAVLLTPGTPYQSSINSPRASNDYYKFQSNTYFLGDIVLSPVDMDSSLQMGVFKNNEYFYSLWYTTQYSFYMFFKNEPGMMEFVVSSLFPSDVVQPYTVEIFPHGTGKYQPPGNNTLATADDMLSHDSNESTSRIWEHAYMFELDPAVQNSYYWKASTDSEDYLIGLVEIFGSDPNYTVEVGKIEGSGPVFDPPLSPGANGKLALDFGYQILGDPGDYVLRLRLSPWVNERRRFITTQFLSVQSCSPETVDSLVHPAHYLLMDGSNTSLSGVLCPPDDSSDYGEILITNDLIYGVPVNYDMTVKSGYDYMTFRIMDKSGNPIWHELITGMGETLTVPLSTIVQDGEEYVVQVFVDPNADRLVLWSVEFTPPSSDFIQNLDFTKGLKISKKLKFHVAP